MKVLMIAPYLPSVLKFRASLIRDIIERGHEVVVCVPDVDAAGRGEIEKIGALVVETPLQRTGKNPFADLGYYRRLRRVIKQQKPDRVFTYTIKPNIWGGFAAAREGIASCALVAGLGHMFAASGPKKSLKTRFAKAAALWLYGRACRHHRRVIFQNPDDVEDFLRAGCLPDRDKTAVVNGSGVDMAHYARAPLPKTPEFLMIARLLTSKGVALYAEAARDLKSRYPEAHFRLVGFFDEGPDGVRRQDMARWQEQGLEFLGEMADIRPAMCAASVYVLPSYYREGTPRSVLEALSMGRPVITTDAPGCRETVADGVNGFLIPPRDGAALVAAMERFLEAPEMIAPMGDAAYELAKTKYEVGAVNAEMMSLMEV